MAKALRTYVVAVLVVAAFGVVMGAHPVIGYGKIQCEAGYWPRPAGIASGVYRCEPAPNRLPPRVGPPPNTAVTRDEVGLYLANIDVLVFHIDFVAGTYHWLALGVPVR